MGKHSDFRISSFQVACVVDALNLLTIQMVLTSAWGGCNAGYFQVVDARRILRFNRKTEKYFKEFTWFFFCWGEGAATRKLP